MAGDGVVIMTIERVAATLETKLPGSVIRGARVAGLTTYRVGGPVAVLVRAGDAAALHAVAEALVGHDLPVLVVGRGSNLLVAEHGFPGVAVLLVGVFEEVEIDAEVHVVRAGGAVPLPVVARRAAAAGLSGLEFLVGIPGSVGGAVRMNAGGHGRETREVLRRAWLFDLLGGRDGRVEQRDVAFLALGYRQSNVASSTVVTRAELAGIADDPAACEERIAEIVRWRREHQPGGSNAGSVFRNPPGDSAGRLIDTAGLKGFRVGGAVVSPKHANFFQAEQGATADDVAALVQAVQARVAAETGIMLEPELEMVGFDTRSSEVHEMERER
jgi:UDP-N-acetylmuramate dehydrogenase